MQSNAGRYPWGATRAVRASALLVGAAMLALLGACALPGGGGSSTATAQFSPIVQHSPIVSSGQVIEQTITQFCGAVHAGNYDQAYTYLSGAYKQTVTSSAKLQSVLGQGTKMLNCAEFGNGGFLKINGSQATDSLVFTVFVSALGTMEQQPGTVTFAQAGSAWQIDGITG